MDLGLAPAHRSPSHPFPGATPSRRYLIKRRPRGQPAEWLISRGHYAAVDAFVSRLDLPVDVDVSTGRLPRDIEASAPFMVAEAPTNVVKHARATHAEVTAAVDEQGLCVEVRDDGVGGAHVGGFGFVGIADRADALGGELRIESRQRGGTVVADRLPLST